MARIVRFNGFGGPEILEIVDLPSQEPGPGEARLLIEAAGINRDHFTLMKGQHFSGNSYVKPDLPSRIGYEAAGIVQAVGEGVDPSWIGKKVSTFFGFDETQYGVLGEEAIIPASFLSEYPPSLTATQAAAFWVPYLTAYGALITIAQLRPGDFISIPAASSSVGLAALQIAHDAGATTIAITRTAAKKEELLALGAHHVVVLADEEYVDRVNEITGGQGVRVTFDPVSGPFLEQLALAAAVGGIIIEYGFMSGEPTPFPLLPVGGKGLCVRGYTVSEITRDSKTAAEAKQYIYDRLANGIFVPKVAKSFSLNQLQDAYTYVETNAQSGRVVIAIL